ncbi:MAG TPA: hypothetical protein VMC03_10605 [Streptosporangiaceae bacterium]|nr:hypothetical protein [Streptosporangiaceae bacterium]
MSTLLAGASATGRAAASTRLHMALSQAPGTLSALNSTGGTWLTSAPVTAIRVRASAKSSAPPGPVGPGRSMMTVSSAGSSRATALCHSALLAGVDMLGFKAVLPSTMTTAPPPVLLTAAMAVSVWGSSVAGNGTTVAASAGPALAHTALTIPSTAMHVVLTRKEFTRVTELASSRFL